MCTCIVHRANIFEGSKLNEYYQILSSPQSFYFWFSAPKLNIENQVNFNVKQHNSIYYQTQFNTIIIDKLCNIAADNEWKPVKVIWTNT